MTFKGAQRIIRNLMISMLEPYWRSLWRQRPGKSPLMIPSYTYTAAHNVAFAIRMVNYSPRCFFER